jgi:chromate transporter
MGMILAGALLLIFPSTKEGASFIDGWSWALFGVALVASLKKVSPILLIALSAVAGVAIYYLPTLFG